MINQLHPSLQQRPQEQQQQAWRGTSSSHRARQGKRLGQSPTTRLTSDALTSSTYHQSSCSARPVVCVVHGSGNERSVTLIEDGVVYIFLYVQVFSFSFVNLFFSLMVEHFLCVTHGPYWCHLLGLYCSVEWFWELVRCRGFMLLCLGDSYLLECVSRSKLFQNFICDAFIMIHDWQCCLGPVTFLSCSFCSMFSVLFCLRLFFIGSVSLKSYVYYVIGRHSATVEHT